MDGLVHTTATRTRDSTPTAKIEEKQNNLDRKSLDWELQKNKTPKEDTVAKPSASSELYKTEWLPWSWRRVIYLGVYSRQDMTNKQLTKGK